MFAEVFVVLVDEVVGGQADWWLQVDDPVLVDADFVVFGQFHDPVGADAAFGEDLDGEGHVVGLVPARAVVVTRTSGARTVRGCSLMMRSTSDSAHRWEGSCSLMR